MTKTISFYCCVFFVLQSIGLLKCQPIEVNNVVGQEGIITTSIRDVLTRGNIPLQSVPISLYSERQLQIQHIINEEPGELVMGYSPVSDTSEWTSIDKEDITPFTWRWIELQQVHSNNDTSFISLRRPLWWLNEIGAHRVGDLVSLDLPEMGIQGLATVTDIRLNQLDTRIIKDVDENGCVTNTITGGSTADSHEHASRPITGKFIHKSRDVYDLYFNNDQSPVSVTSNHPFWSVDRNSWIGAAALQIGEKVKALNDDCVVKNRVKKDGTYQVYNLEVYRTHNYYVSREKILVHNICILEYLKSDAAKLILGKRHVVTDSKHFKVILANRTNSGMFRLDYGLGVKWQGGNTDGMILEALDKITDRKGEIMVFLDDVDIAAAQRGFNDFWLDASMGNITEWELSVILRNREYYDITKVTINGNVVPISQVEGLEYLGKD